MKRALVAFAVLCVTPLAHGQATCADYQKIADEASTRFAAFRGKEISPGHFKSTGQVFPFWDCTLTDIGMAVLTCSRTSTAVGPAIYEVLAKQVRECFPSWSAVPTDNSPLARYPTVSILKTQMLVAPDNPSHRIAVGLAREAGQMTYNVSINFAVGQLQATS